MKRAHNKNSNDVRSKTALELRDVHMVDIPVRILNALKDHRFSLGLRQLFLLANRNFTCSWLDSNTLQVCDQEIGVSSHELGELVMNGWRQRKQAVCQSCQSQNCSPNSADSN